MKMNIRIHLKVDTIKNINFVKTQKNIIKINQNVKEELNEDIRL
jgi:hypothetical protein